MFGKVKEVIVKHKIFLLRGLLVIKSIRLSVFLLSSTKINHSQT